MEGPASAHLVAATTGGGRGADAGSTSTGCVGCAADAGGASTCAERCSSAYGDAFDDTGTCGGGGAYGGGGACCSGGTGGGNAQDSAETSRAQDGAQDGA